MAPELCMERKKDDHVAQCETSETYKLFKFHSKSIQYIISRIKNSLIIHLFLMTRKYLKIYDCIVTFCVFPWIKNILELIMRQRLSLYYHECVTEQLSKFKRNC